MPCLNPGCTKPVADGREHCEEHGWIEQSGHDPSAIGTSANTNQGVQRPRASKAEEPALPSDAPRITTNTEDE
jgi:hypothetical protein